MNYLYRFLVFLDPKIRQLHADNRALAKSLKVKFDPANHPISERDRLFSIDFNQAQHFLAPPYSPPLPTRTPVTFDLRGCLEIRSV
jgi:hypothetical protein